MFISFCLTFRKLKARTCPIINGLAECVNILLFLIISYTLNSLNPCGLYFIQSQVYLVWN